MLYEVITILIGLHVMYGVSEFANGIKNNLSPNNESVYTELLKFLMPNPIS